MSRLFLRSMRSFPRAGHRSQDGQDRRFLFRENRDEPGESLIVRNSIANQFELPVLFHLCCVLLYLTEADNLLSLGLAWLFVALRYAHAFIHVTSNRLRYRQPLFMAGFLVLVAMWTWLSVWMAMS